MCLQDDKSYHTGRWTLGHMILPRVLHQQCLSTTLGYNRDNKSTVTWKWEVPLWQWKQHALRVSWLGLINIMRISLFQNSVIDAFEVWVSHSRMMHTGAHSLQAAADPAEHHRGGGV